MTKEQFALKALERYPSKVRFVYIPYPSSDFSFKLAEAVEAAGAQGKFWEMHRALIEDVPGDVAELISLAQGVGLDMDQFNEALDIDKYRGKIEAAKRRAESNGITGVTLFINGKEYSEYPGTLDDLYHAIDKELERIGEKDAS